MRLTVHFEDAGSTTVAQDSLTYRCGGSKEKAEPYTGVYLLSEAEQAPYLSLPTAEGDLPCGVFDVNGHGRKYIGLADFPGCTAPVTVMCLNGEGEWTAGNVSNVLRSSCSHD